MMIRFTHSRISVSSPVETTKRSSWFYYVILANTKLISTAQHCSHIGLRGHEYLRTTHILLRMKYNVYIEFALNYEQS